MPLLSRPASILSWWRQLPSIYKLISVTVAIVFLLATGLQSGTVDVNQQWNSILRGVGRESLGGGMPIRLMYVGASMTLGEHSKGQRGYRLQIRDWIAAKGNLVNCVGGNRFGDFVDNDVQAWGAQPILPTLERAREIVPAVQPNLILINVGSSDCFQEDAWGSAHVLDHIRELTEFLLQASPRATVVLSTIIFSPWDHVDRCVRSANAQIRQVARDLARAGKPVLLAEMHRDQGLPGRVDVPTMGPDNMHPTTEGYFLMGEIFKEAILEADKKGMLQRAVPNGIPEDGNAERIGEARQEEQLTERDMRLHARRWSGS